MSKSKLDYYLEKRAQIRAEHEATYADRKAKAFASGRFLWFLACPTCGLNKPLKRHEREDTSFQVTADFPILQRRYGGGARRRVVSRAGRIVDIATIEGLGGPRA